MPKRSPAQEVMDAARGDARGEARSAAWEAYSALQAETNARGWDPPGPPSPWAIESRGFRPVTFPVGDIRPWRFHEPSTVSVPADPGPHTKRKG